MADNPMFYQKITTLNREVHKGLKIDLSEVRFGFTRAAHMIPAVIDEFFAGGRALPIVFLPGPQRATPVFLLGFEPGENLFVGRDGNWTADYLPAFIRRYPFIIGEVQGGQPLICIDESAASLSSEHGEPLFLDDASEAPMLREVVKFTADYMAAANRTNEFVDLLQKHALFTGITIAVRLPGSENKTLHGAMSIDVAKFDALTDEAFLDLRKKGFLQPIYSQISSVALIDKLAMAKPKPVAPSSAGDDRASSLGDLEREDADLLN